MALPDEVTQTDEAPRDSFAPAVLASRNPTTLLPLDTGVRLVESRPAAQTRTPVWHDEISGRVQKFRRKRARLRGGFDSSTTLDLEFEHGEENSAGEIDSPIGDRAIEFGGYHGELRVEAGDETPEVSILDAQTLAPLEPQRRVLSGAAIQAGETLLGQQNLTEESVEIFLDSVRSTAPATPGQWGLSADPRALLGRRFLAGIADALVLLAGGAMFAAIFWAVCLQPAGISSRPANLIALCSIVACLIFFYFGMSVALTATTPGLAWMGLEVRNLDGELPTTRESLWRAFGYLVSASALFLGFIWALLDTDGLAWHDLMSETYVTQKL